MDLRSRDILLCVRFARVANLSAKGIFFFGGGGTRLVNLQLGWYVCIGEIGVNWDVRVMLK